MQYLTPSEIRKVAPAIARLPYENNLIDTTVFLRHAGDLGYRPIMALQGTPHADANSKDKGRHLLVTADRNGRVIALLNSHTVWRKAWIGYGFVVNAQSDSITFMIGAALPLRRWRGFEAELDGLLSRQHDIGYVRSKLVGWQTTIHQRRWMARHYASTAYLPGHKTPMPNELLVKVDCLALTQMNIAMSRVLGGNLEPARDRPHRGLKPRKLKPVKSPDAVFKASNAAFRTGMAAITKYTGVKYAAFPAFGPSKD